MVEGEGSNIKHGAEQDDAGERRSGAERRTG
jgi:hypothetical protein